MAGGADGGSVGAGVAAVAGTAADAAWETGVHCGGVQRWVSLCGEGLLLRIVMS